MFSVKRTAWAIVEIHVIVVESKNSSFTGKKMGKISDY